MQAKMAIMDTGMSLAFIPPADFDALKRYLEDGREMRIEKHPEHNLWTVDCSGSKCRDLPDIQMEFRNENHAGKLFRLPSKKYLVQNGLWSSEFIFALQPSPLTLEIPGGDESDPPAWILGDAFLSEFYSIYDYPRARIGLVETSETAGTVSASKVATILVLFSILVCLPGLCCVVCCFFKPIEKLRTLFRA